MEETTAAPAVGHSELHAIIRNAQVAMWNTGDEPAALAYMVVDLEPSEIYQQFLNLLPDSEIANHYRNCRTCERAIKQCGNWVVVNYDGTLDSVMFPAIEIDDEFRNEWVNLMIGMTDYITTEPDTLYPRRVRGLLCRPTDGGQMPTFMRMLPDDQLHFDVFMTPPTAVTARTLCKLKQLGYETVEALLASPGFNYENIVGIMDTFEKEYPGYDFRTRPAFEAASHVLHAMDVYCKTNQARYNLMVAASPFAEGLKDFPIHILHHLDEFEKDGDLIKLIRWLQLADI